MTPRVVFDDVRKTFRLRNRSDSLRDAIPRLLARGVGRGEPAAGRYVALDGMSFTVEDGEVVGIVGANGAGKSTSLRLAARVYEPDSGTIHVRGRLSALIELSAGFHPDLSGRENIHLVGALHGMRRREIDARMGEIVEFADIGEFLDAPVRTYSTGMAVRLGFAVAANVPAEVLLIDEVLAVGDAEFRAKCLRRMARRKDDGVSIVFVSHDLSMMEQFCDRLLFVHHGRVLAEGRPPEVVAAYRRTVADEQRATLGNGARTSRLRSGTHDLAISDVSLNGGTGVVDHGGVLHVRASWSAKRALRGVRLIVRIHTINGVPCAAVPADAVPDMLAGRGEFDIEIRGMPLLPGSYDLSLEARDASGLVVLDHHDRLHPLTVGGVGPAGAEGLVALAAHWSFVPRPD